MTKLKSSLKKSYIYIYITLTSPFFCPSFSFNLFFFPHSHSASLNQYSLIHSLPHTINLDTDIDPAPIRHQSGLVRDVSIACDSRSICLRHRLLHRQVHLELHHQSHRSAPRSDHGLANPRHSSSSFFLLPVSLSNSHSHSLMFVVGL